MRPDTSSTRAAATSARDERAPCRREWPGPTPRDRPRGDRRRRRNCDEQVARLRLQIECGRVEHRLRRRHQEHHQQQDRGPAARGIPPPPRPCHRDAGGDGDDRERRGGERTWQRAHAEDRDRHEMRAVPVHPHQADGRRGEVTAHLRKRVEHLALCGDRMQRWQRAPELHGVANEPPPREHDRGDDQRQTWNARSCRAYRTATSTSSRIAGTHTVSLASTASATANPTPNARRGVSSSLCITTTPASTSSAPASHARLSSLIAPARYCVSGNSATSAAAPTASAGRSGKRRRATAADGQHREHPEDHRHQPDQASVIAGELGDDRAQEVVQRRLLALGLACRREPEMVGDTGDVVQVRELIRRRPDGGDARVRHGEPGEDGDDRREQPPVTQLDAMEQRDTTHGSRCATSARTHTVSG